MPIGGRTPGRLTAALTARSLPGSPNSTGSMNPTPGPGAKEGESAKPCDAQLHALWRGCMRASAMSNWRFDR